MKKTVDSLTLLGYSVSTIKRGIRMKPQDLQLNDYLIYIPNGMLTKVVSKDEYSVVLRHPDATNGCRDERVNSRLGLSLYERPTNPTTVPKV